MDQDHSERELEGLVLRSTGSWYEVQPNHDGAVVSCRAGGRLRLLDARSTNPIAVGDRVRFILDDAEGTGLITELESRVNSIVRKSVNLSKETHVVAANLDRAFLVVTVSEPRTSTGFMDRFLVTAEAYGVPTTIVMNKYDQCTPGSKAEDLMNEYRQIYLQSGYEVLPTSAITGEGLDELKSIMAKSGVNLLSGHSGVGKSSLINALIPELNLKTGDVSASHSKGKHTTTFAEMFRLASGGYIIDTPGIKGFGLVALDKDKIHHYFPEMFARLNACKFHNCTHLTEPKCAVRSAVEANEIPVSRYENYVELVEKFDEDSTYR